MRRFAVVAAPLLWCASIAAQTPASVTQFIAARQTEVERLAKALYSTQLNDGTWQRHVVPPCGQVLHHAFARFDETPAGGRSAHFLAIYDLDKAPAHPADKPWRGGILLLRVHPHSGHLVGSMPDGAAVIAAFNRVLQQERATQPQAAAMDNLAIANCFLHVSGEELMSSDTSSSPPETQDNTAGPVLAVVIPLASDAGFLRTQYVTFDDHGLIAEAGVNVQPAAP